MRKTEFRGLRCNGKGWWHGEFYSKMVAMGNIAYINGCFDEKYMVEWNSICEYTGLKDKNSIKIYEGDIVKDNLGDVGSILFSDGVFWLGYFNEPAKQYLYEFVIKDKFHCSTGVVELEVIGNIHEKK